MKMHDNSYVNLYAVADTIRISVDLALDGKNIAQNDPRRIKLQDEANRIALLVESNRKLLVSDIEWLMRLIYKKRPTSTMRAMRSIFQEIGKCEVIE